MSAEKEVSQIDCPACATALRVEFVHGCEVRRIELSTGRGGEVTERASAEAMVQVLMRRTAGAAVDLFAADPHRWSTRSCVTCRTISDLLGAPFGCYAFAKLPAEQQNRAHGGN